MVFKNLLRTLHLVVTTVKTCLRDMTRVPSGFSILTEKENVVVLRHILRDAAVIVPKRTACMDVGDTVWFRDDEPLPPSGYITEWFPCGHSTLRVEQGLWGIPPLMISCTCQEDREDGNLWEKDPGVGEAPMLRVLSSSEYHEILPTGFRSDGYVFNQSVCLLPEMTDIVAPGVLSFAGCVAVMYTFNVFKQLSIGEARRMQPCTAFVHVNSEPRRGPGSALVINVSEGILHHGLR